jgi:O-antigen/teichoic acid export membrane protein
MSLAKKAISGALWTSGISYIGFFVTFCIQLILVRLLAPEDFGLFALGLSIAEILFIFFSFSFSLAVIQIQEADDLFDTAFYLSIFAGLVIVFIGGILSQALSSYYPERAIMIFAVLCAISPIQGCALIYTASMEKEMQFKKTAFAGSIASNLSAVGTVILAYAGFGVWSLAGKEIMRAVLMFFSTRLMSSYRFKRKFNRDTAKKLVSFGFKMVFSRGLEVLYYRAPQFFIGTFAGTAMLGLFSQTYYIASVPNVVLLPVTTHVAFSTYSKLQNDKDRMSEAFYITNYFFIRLLLPLMLVLFLYPKDVITILYGEKWTDASPILRCISVYAAFVPLFFNAKTFAYGSGKLIEVSKAYLLKTVLLAIGMTIALSVNKVYLVALSYSVSIIIGLFAVFSFLKKNGMDLRAVKLFLVPAAFSAVIAFIWPLVTNIINMPFPQENVMRFVYLLVLYIVFVTALFLCEPKMVMNNFRYLQKKLIFGK